MRTNAAFVVQGDPAPKPVGPRTHKAMGAWARYAAYKKHIGLSANGQFPLPAEGPVELSVRFYLRLPRNRSKLERRRASTGLDLPTGKPDLKNLIAAVEDSLTGIAWPDDSSVVSYGFAYKRWAVEYPPRTFILVRDLPQGLKGNHWDITRLSGPRSNPDEDTCG